jgi:kinesin family protein 1
LITNLSPTKSDNDFEETKQPVEERRTSILNPKRRMTKVLNDKSIPHLTNLHEDPLMSGIVYYSLLKGEINIGRKTGKPVPEIILGAIGIKPNHAIIKLLKNGLFELTVCDAEAANTTMVNGK